MPLFDIEDRDWVVVVAHDSVDDLLKVLEASW